MKSLRSWSILLICEDCQDDGYIDVVDPNTGGVLGPSPCPNPECPYSIYYGAEFNEGRFSGP